MVFDPLLKGINIFQSNMLLKNQSTAVTVSTFLKEINIFHFSFSTAPESAVSCREGCYKERAIAGGGLLYRLNLKTIYNLVRVSGHGGRSGSPRTDRKLKSNMFMPLTGGRHGTVDSSL
jgi:hypothetical protein